MSGRQIVSESRWYALINIFELFANYIEVIFHRTPVWWFPLRLLTCAKWTGSTRPPCGTWSRLPILAWGGDWASSQKEKKTLQYSAFSCKIKGLQRWIWTQGCTLMIFYRLKGDECGVYLHPFPATDQRLMKCSYLCHDKSASSAVLCTQCLILPNLSAVVLQ